MNNIISGLFLTGVLFGSGPCVASCGPFLISYIAGTRKTAARGVVAYILFSSARVSVYIALGVSVFFLSRFAVERLLGGL
ncbi:MAG: sulfite exporter TauE/SafE family protein, partial [Candidatus Omnitrophota bacterium]